MPCWGLCEAQRAEHRPQHCPARRRMTAPPKGAGIPLHTLAARCCPPAGGLLSGPHYKRGVAPRGRVAPQRHRGVEGGALAGVPGLQGGNVAARCRQRGGPGVGSDAAADSGPAAECSSTGASMVAPALGNGCCCTRSARPAERAPAPAGAGYADRDRPGAGGLV